MLISTKLLEDDQHTSTFIHFGSSACSASPFYVWQWGNAARGPHCPTATLLVMDSGLNRENARE